MFIWIMLLVVAGCLCRGIIVLSRRPMLNMLTKRKTAARYTFMIAKSLMT